MWNEILALQAQITQLQNQIKPLLQPTEPPPVPIEDPEKAQRDYDAAQLEVQNQQERAAVNIKAAEDNAARTKAILDASLAAAPPMET